MENIKKTEIRYPFLPSPVEVYERENGHKIVFAKKEGGLVNISSWVKTGSINENDEINGISHFLEHLMFKGTHKHPAGYFDRTLEAKGAIVNAATWKDYTYYYVTLPKGPENSYFYEAIELHGDMMLDPVIPEEEIGPAFSLDDNNVKEKRERHVVIEEIRMRQDQPWTKVYNEANYNMYKTHPYKRDVIGFAEIIASVSRETIMDYYRKYYTPNNITTIVAGEFDSGEILEKVISAFDFKGRQNTEKNHFELDTPEAKYIENYAHINTGFSIIGWLGPVACSIKENIALEIANIILGEGQSSRLYQNLIEKAQKPVFNVVASDYYSFRDGGNFFVQANFKPEYKDEAVSMLKNEVEKLSDTGEREFKKAVKKLKVRFAESAETVSDIADTIGYYMTVCDNIELVEEYQKELENINLSEFKNLVKKYLPLDSAVVSVLMPEKKD